MNRTFKVMACIIACLCLFACGQRGPLQLPEQPISNTPSAKPTQSPAQEEDS